MATLSIRIDDNLKKKAVKTLNNMGLDISTAVKLFLSQTVKDDSLPFRPKNNPKVIRAMWDKEVEEALKHGKSYTSAEELFKDLDNDID